MFPLSGGTITNRVLGLPGGSGISVGTVPFSGLDPAATNYAYGSGGVNFNPNNPPPDDHNLNVVLYGFDTSNFNTPNSWLSCFDPIWSTPGSFCEFQAGAGNSIQKAPFDPGSWATGGGIMPGNMHRLDNDQNQYFMIRCACERAGLPHDSGLSLNAAFNGFRAGSSFQFATFVPSGHCSCFDPGRAATSAVNSGLASQIAADCQVLPGDSKGNR
jgi:hypothetical protein